MQASLAEKEAKLSKLTTALQDSDGEIWGTYKTEPPPGHAAMLSRNEPVIITTANLKGGVGKSTVTANLACYFRAKGRRVLLIDLDYQGSLTNTLLTISGVQRGIRAKNAANLFRSGADGGTILDNLIPLESNNGVFDFVPTFYEFTKEENRLQVRWLLQEDGDDLRYRLSRVLLNDTVRGRYDIVLIDTPPRLTTGTINALCASTHFLVPTVLDNTSAEAVENFVSMVKHNITPLNPSLKLLGVVGTMTLHRTGLSAWELAAIDRINSEMPWTPKKRVFKRHIPRKAAISRAAGRDFAYNSDNQVRQWFEALGTEVDTEIYGVQPDG
ncbi:MAG: ParA family protein [Hyphomicrobiales bacterium]|nr:ParA family protein [Hyphomicrobiales bacterium]